MCVYPYPSPCNRSKGIAGEPSLHSPPKVHTRVSIPSPPPLPSSPFSFVQNVSLTCSSATGFSKLFPGITPHLLTLASNFRIPLYRDLILSLGICSVSKQSCSNILKSGPGSSITIVVGGAAESLSARPGTADLTLRRRLGFIKVAIQHG